MTRPPPDDKRRRAWERKRIRKRRAAADTLCSDTCASAHNGVCEDGGDLGVEHAPQGADAVARMAAAIRKSAVRIRCDWGTDCTDCRTERPRQVPVSLSDVLGRGASGSAAEPPASAPAVSSLVKKGVAFMAAWTATQPTFIMPYTDHGLDVDVSLNVHSNRVVEPLYNLYWRRLTDACCAKGDRPRCRDAVMPRPARWRRAATWRRLR